MMTIEEIKGFRELPRIPTIHTEIILDLCDTALELYVENETIELAMIELTNLNMKLEKDNERLQLYEEPDGGE